MIIRWYCNSFTTAAITVVFGGTVYGGTEIKCSLSFWFMLNCSPWAVFHRCIHSVLALSSQLLMTQHIRQWPEKKKWLGILSCGLTGGNLPWESSSALLRGWKKPWNLFLFLLPRLQDIKCPRRDIHVVFKRLEDEGWRFIVSGLQQLKTLSCKKNVSCHN